MQNGDLVGPRVQITYSINCGRGERIRTSDPLLPKQMRYQAALHPDSKGRIVGIV